MTSSCSTSGFVAAGIVAIALVGQAVADEAYRFEAIYTGEYWQSTSGGLQRDDQYLDNLDLAVEVDGEQAFGIRGGTAFAYVLYNNGSTLSAATVGDAQTVSNIDNGQVIRLYEVWYQQEWGNRQSLKFGLYDLNSEFDVIEPAGLFINSSHGIGPDYSQSGENGPSIFPTTSLAVRYLGQLAERIVLQAAILDAVPGDPDDPQRNRIKLNEDEGALTALEANYAAGGIRLGLGGWYYTKKSGTIDGTKTVNNSGIYGIYCHQLMSAGDHGRDLAVWTRYGLARESVNSFGSYVGAGVVLSNFVPGRADDALGFAIAHARFSDSYRDGLAAVGSKASPAESNFELTYRASIGDRVVIQPDIQFIHSPGGDFSLKDALVMGVRAQITLF